MATSPAFLTTARRWPRDRTAAEVILDHLDCRNRGDVREDIKRNYAWNARMMSRRDVGRGGPGVIREAEELARRVPGIEIRITSFLVEGDIGFVEWSARGRGVRVDDGADTLVVDRGRIACHTTSYTVRRA